MDIESLSPWALFISAFISSTVFPGGSEVVLFAMLQQAIHPAWLLVVVATVGNTLGGLTTFFLGYLCALGYSPEKLLKNRHQPAVTRIQRWGSPILLFSWLPVIGDPLCFAAGWLKLGLWQSILFIALGKALRYGVLVALV